MKGVPHVYWARELRDWSVSQAGPSGIYTMARPEGFYGLCFRWRLSIAWKVFKGEYDAVRWSELP